MNFDFVAPVYSTLEHLAFGRALERTRESMFPELGRLHRALLIGDGDGRFLASFVRQFPEAAVDYVDASPIMARLANKRLRPGGDVRFHVANILTGFRPEGNYDLVTTHFVLDVFTRDEIRELLERLRNHTAGALWIVSEFEETGSGLTRWASFAAIRLMYLFFAVTAGLRVNAVPDHRTEFRAAGFRLLRSKSSWGGFLYSELWQAPAATETGWSDCRSL